jgi:hypothetical protein
MGGACGTYSGKKKYTWFWCGNLEERADLQDQDINGRAVF